MSQKRQTGPEGQERLPGRDGFLRILLFIAVAITLSGSANRTAAQTVTQRGFVDAAATVFPQKVPNDPTQIVGDLLGREEVFFKPNAFLQFAGGIDGRANSHDQVDRSWHVDVRDRGRLRPTLSVRRLSATFTRGPITIDAGKQFIRWGKADIVTPTDHFAPRDFLNVIDNEFIAVTGVRASVQWEAESLEAVWVPFFTPSRTPLLSQRWTALPAGLESVMLFEASGPLPDGSQEGIRWGHTTGAYEFSASYYHGFNHQPNIGITPGPLPSVVGIAKTYPAMRSFGFDVAVPTGWLTLKGEAAYARSPTPATDDYILYVVQLERQSGEWTLVGGYAGEVVTEHRAQLTFAPDRGLTRSIVGRASYTIDTNRSAAIESAIRQNGDGAYVKGEYSQAYGQHWRATIDAVLIRGHQDDFLGQYRRNSHLMFATRYSF